MTCQVHLELHYLFALKRILSGSICVPHTFIVVICYAVGAIVGIAVGGAVLAAAVIATVVYCIHRRRMRSAAPTSPTGFQAQPDAPKPDEAAAALSLVATAQTAVPGGAATAGSAIALTGIRRPVEAIAEPKPASVEEQKGI